MAQTTERGGYAQFYPADSTTAFLLYDSPSEWGLRIDENGLEIGEAADIEGEYPHYVVSLPSGMKATITSATTAHVQGATYSALVGLGDRLDVAEALRETLGR